MLKFLAAVAVTIINHKNVNLFRELEIGGIWGEYTYILQWVHMARRSSEFRTMILDQAIFHIHKRYGGHCGGIWG